MRDGVSQANAGQQSTGELFLLCQIERDINEHVFLPAHHLAPAECDKDCARIEPGCLGGLLGMAQEAGLGAGIPITGKLVPTTLRSMPASSVTLARY